MHVITDHVANHVASFAILDARRQSTARDAERPVESAAPGLLGYHVARPTSDTWTRLTPFRRPHLATVRGPRRAGAIDRRRRRSISSGRTYGQHTGSTGGRSLPQQQQPRPASAAVTHGTGDVAVRTTPHSSSRLRYKLMLFYLPRTHSA